MMLANRALSMILLLRARLAAGGPLMVRVRHRTTPLVRVMVRTQTQNPL